MFTSKDIEQIEKKGSNLSEIEKQITHFRKGFPFLKVIRPATIGDGIIRLDEEQVTGAVKQYVQKVKDGLQPVKFVPASGAASRMFHALFSFAEAADNNDAAAEILDEHHHKGAARFFGHLSKFAFYERLVASTGGMIDVNGRLKYCEIIDQVLLDKGLNYGFLPKGPVSYTHLTLPTNREV